MKTSRFFRAILVATALGAALCAQAGLLGNTVNVQRQYLSASNPFVSDLGDKTVVAPGVEYDDVFRASPQYPGTIDLSDTTFTLTTNFAAEFTPDGPNGFLVTALTGVTITGATYVSGIAPVDVTVANGALFIDYRGVLVTEGATSLLSIQTQPVPEPATMAVLGVGALGLVRRRLRA